MRASVMFKLMILGLSLGTLGMAFLFAGYEQAKPFAILGALLGFGAIAFGALANLIGALKNDLHDDDESS